MHELRKGEWGGGEVEFERRKGAEQNAQSEEAEEEEEAEVE